MPLNDQNDPEDGPFSSSLVNVRQVSQASEVETQESTIQTTDVDHNLLLKPTSQAIC